MSVVVLTFECYDLYWVWTSVKILTTKDDRWTIRALQVIVSYSLGGAVPCQRFCFFFELLLVLSRKLASASWSLLALASIPGLPKDIT